MPRKKQDLKLVRKTVFDACEELRRKGEQLTVTSVAAATKKSCRDVSKPVAEWKELHETTPPATIYTEPEKDIRNEGIRLLDKLVADVAGRRVTEEQVTWENRIANVRSHKAEELEAAFIEVDTLREQVKALRRKNTDLAKRLKEIQLGAKVENLMELSDPDKSVEVVAPDGYHSAKEGTGTKGKTK